MPVPKSQFDTDLATSQTAQGKEGTDYGILSPLLAKIIAELNALIALVQAAQNIDYTSEDTIVTGMTTAATATDTQILADTAAINAAIAAAEAVTGS